MVITKLTFLAGALTVSPKRRSGPRRLPVFPRERIVKLAREIATAKPAYISQGWGPQRHANGEIATRAISMLAILTGNVGINGGNSGAREGSYSLPLSVCRRWRIRLRPVSRCLCGPMRLSAARK
ncbi:molybdopterin-dependent oxidoreductase [Klebsiella pneumoniae subsp. pneumoniae]|nr:molybdopterin-dependent oxidoreductase [Klebsiella pneumoniae subsp. pneumoniae]